MVMRIPPEVLASILNDDARSLQAVGEVSPLFCRPPPGEAHLVNFAGEFFKALLRKGLRQVTDVFPEQRDKRGALVGVEGFARESDGGGDKSILASSGYDVPPTVAQPSNFLLLVIEAL